MDTTHVTMSLKEVADILNYKNRRSAIRWCINNGVEIFSFHGSARKFVIRAQFEWVRYQKMFTKMVKKNPELQII